MLCSVDATIHVPVKKKVERQKEREMLSCTVCEAIVFTPTQDTHTLNVTGFRNTLANVSALRLVDLEKADMRRFLHDWTNSELRYGRRALEMTALKVSLQDWHKAKGCGMRSIARS